MGFSPLLLTLEGLSGPSLDLFRHSEEKREALGSMAVAKLFRSESECCWSHFFSSPFSVRNDGWSLDLSFSEMV